MEGTGLARFFVISLLFRYITSLSYSGECGDLQIIDVDDLEDK